MRSPSTFRQLPILLLLPVLPAALTGWLHPRRPDWHTALHPPQAESVGWAHAVFEHLLWVDARPAAAFAAGHVPGAINLNDSNWDEQLPALIAAWEPGKLILVYCDSSACGTSREVVARLTRDYGFDRIFYLDGGWEAWLASDRTP